MSSPSSEVQKIVDTAPMLLGNFLGKGSKWYGVAVFKRGDRGAFPDRPLSKLSREDSAHRSSGVPILPSPALRLS